METTEEDKKKAKQREYQKTYRIKNAEFLKLKNKQYREENKEAIHENRKLYRANNKDVIKKDKKRQYIENSEKIKECSKKRYRTNILKLREYRRMRYQNNKIEENYKRKMRYHKDPIFKTIVSLRSYIGKVLKSQSAKKLYKTLDGIGCTPEFLRSHLESQFREGMSWDNHAPKGWHVDHIKPCSSFDLNNPEEQKMVNHYTNLQPLWWWENLEKSDKLIFPQTG